MVDVVSDLGDQAVPQLPRDEPNLDSLGAELGIVDVEHAKVIHPSTSMDSLKASSGRLLAAVLASAASLLACIRKIDCGRIHEPVRRNLRTGHFN